MGLKLFTCFADPASLNPTSSKNVIPPRKNNFNLIDNKTNDGEQKMVSSKGPIMVELFSSQGCSISRQADMLLTRLGRGDFTLDVPLILLGFHVDYWDHLGWKDPFGSNEWTVRQKAYVEALKLDTLSTPQFVIQGRAQCEGNDEEAILSNIASAYRFPALNLQASFKMNTTEDKIEVNLNGDLRTPIVSEGMVVMLALYENGLLTNCLDGVNKDHAFSNNYVVRRLVEICNVNDISAKKPTIGVIEISLWEGFNSSKCGMVVFVQDSSYQIYGSQNFQLPDKIKQFKRNKI